MASTPVTLLTRRSGNSADRPFPTTIQAGEMAINFGAAENGMYFKDSAGNIRKVAGTHYGGSAPNSAGVGQPGNSVGETWVNSAAPYYLSVWDGANWQRIGAAFADSSTTSTVTIASGALSANGAILASGALNAQGAVLASGVVTATGVPVAGIYTGAFPPVGELGTLIYRNDVPSGLYISVNGGWALT